ncbi:hypothetical protein [Flavobacterium sp. GCM10027622]|uniref:hypothetical protein n=1 Tax=unclassified Flavobacterium TaxID=196869 RepID=UPI0036196CF9
MKEKGKLGVIIGLSLLLFSISLTQTCIVIDFKEIVAIPSFNYFLMGSTAILGGAVLEWIIWFANPLCLLTILLLVFNNKLAITTSLTALFLASSFRFWKEILGAESGSMAKIISFESGYYLWVISIALLTAGTLHHFLATEKTKSTT